jgi:WhiB family redox-sensing transcriptional regulator
MAAWEDRAACSNMPTSMFFEDVAPEDDEGNPLPLNQDALARARAVCQSCPVRTDCYLAAMAEEGGAAESRRYGIRGGTTPGQRYSIWRRDSLRCERCNEAYDPLGLVAGEAVCGCGFNTEPPIADVGDTWYPRHDGLLARLIDYLLENTKPGDRILPPYRMLEALGHRRKDDMPLVYQRLIDDGLIEKGPGRGEYYRRAGKGALLRWSPPAHRRRHLRLVQSGLDERPAAGPAEPGEQRAA